MSIRNRIIGGGLAGVIVLLVDQYSKYWVLNVLDLEHVRSVVVLPTLNFTMVWNRGITHHTDRRP